MTNRRTLTMLVLVIGGIAPSGFAQIDPTGGGIPVAAPPGAVPLDITPLESSVSPFSEPMGMQEVPRADLLDSRDLVLQPGLAKSPERISLDPVAGKADAGNFGVVSGTGAQFQVPLGQGRILTLKDDLTEGKDEPLLAIGNPGILDVAIISDRQLRLTGIRVGVTDLSITTAKGDTTHYEIQVLADLVTLQKKIRVAFPEASVHLSQIQNNVIVEGQARSQLQVTQIIGMVSAYLDAMSAMQRLTSRGSAGGAGMNPMDAAALSSAAGSGSSAGSGDGLGAISGVVGGATEPGEIPGQVQAGQSPGAGDADAFVSTGRASQVTGALPNASIVNLLKVPTSQQVMLKVRIAEVNRTGLRDIGANFLAIDEANRAIFGTQIAGSVSGGAIAAGSSLLGEVSTPISPVGNRGGTTVFGIFQNANFEMPLNALRRNGLLKILAEPNLVAMSGQPSNFLVGGEFPVPVPQVGASGVAPTITVQFKQFGVRLGFIPYVLDDETLRLTVAPEVSEIDFAISVSLVSGGSPVPGLNVRRSLSTVEMKHGQTLAIAGLLYLKMDGTTDRVPGLGDLPVLGPFFSNTSNERIEKELVILITPYIVEPMAPDQVPPVPGSDVGEPTDWELYFLNRIESRKGVDFRSTTAWDNAQEKLYLMKMQKKVLKGEVGFSD